VPDDPDPDLALLPEDGSWQTILTVLVVQGVQLAEDEDPRSREACLKGLTELEPLVQQLGRVPDGAEPARPAPTEKARTQELEKALQEMSRALRQKKGNNGPRDKVPGKLKVPLEEPVRDGDR
jgi:hypothetical protein